MATDWERFKKLTADALELAPSDRAAFIESECGDDPALRAQLDRLLNETCTEHGVLDAPPELPSVEFDLPRTDSLVGATLGSFEVVRLLGRGGMGAVYEAKQENPRRSVALKVLREELSSPQHRMRFHYESQILARLKHPAIAQVYEAGVWNDDQRGDVPYFAMEFIDGATLLNAVAAGALDRRSRLELFIQICEGVQHAHQSGVVHRDLKPDNVLIAADGRAKILDFGIARLRSDDGDDLATLRTSVGEVLGTIAYMSPEQLSGEPDAIDTRTDVYALGVILHQLLTGELPLQLSSAALPEAVRRIVEAEPSPPSSVDPTCRGDLDTIVAAALEKDKTRRYASASELAADVRRFLDDEPIAARRASAFYQLAKFTRRHKGLVTGAVAALLALVIAIVGTSYGFYRATVERDAAQAAREEAEAGIAFLRTMLSSVDPDELGRNVTVLEVLDRAASEVDRVFATKPNVRATLHSTLGWTYYSLGNLASAQRELEASSTLFASLLGAEHERTLEEQNRLVQVLADAGRLDEAETLLGRTEAAASSLARAHAVSLGLVESRAHLHVARDELKEAEDLYRNLIEQQAAEYGAGDESVLRTRNSLAGVLRLKGDLDGAESVFENVYNTRKSTLGVDKPATVLAGMNFAMARSTGGKTREAEALFRELLPVAMKTWGSEHSHVLTLKNNLAASLTRLGKLEEAEGLSREALAIYTKLYGASHEGSVSALNNLVVTLGHAKRPEEAEPLAQKLVRILEASRGRDHHETLTAVANLGGMLSDLGRHGEAEPLVRRTLERQEKSAGAAHPQTLITRNNYARLLGKLSRHEESLALLEANLKLAEEGQPGHPINTLYFRFNLGQCLLDLGRIEEARPHVVAAQQKAAELWDEQHPHRQKIASVLGGMVPTK